MMAIGKYYNSMRDYTANTNDFNYICSDAGVIGENLSTGLHGLLTVFASLLASKS